MIIKFDELKKHRHSVTMVGGGFDPIHKGHIDYFKEALGLGLPVLCSIDSDEYVRMKHVPFLPEEYRAAIIDSIRYISLTHINPQSTAAVLRELQPRYYVKGKDWEGHLPDEEIEVCQQFGIEIVYVDTVLDSSSDLLGSYASKLNSIEMESFQKLVFSQKPVPSTHYDQEYFTGNWRPEGNKYSLDKRREIEGQNPRLIKEVFQPERVLDLGCGPGVLMYLLYELGVTADGIDFSPHSREFAPPEVRDRIMIGSVTEHLVPDDSYDLVICREVLEHLTVLQVRQTVQNICRVTSRYIYLTTRFHPNPTSLLDVTDQADFDPTHITLLNKDLLRLLFVLEGLKCRPDLEKKMDWLNKGRVLVYEKQPGMKRG